MGAAADHAMAGVMPAHRFDPAPLWRYLHERLPGCDGAMRIDQVQGGVSNPTLLLSPDFAGSTPRYVLRKKPSGALLPSAHRIDREYRVMAALADRGVPVPQMLLYCDDPAIIGTEFYVMAYLAGRVFRDARLPNQSPAERAAIYDALNATLARLHSVDPAAAGLADYGPVGNYFERQIARWTKQYRASQTETIAAMEELIARLPGSIPDDQDVRIAHGDYRLENVMYHPTEPRIVGILDWELSTLGHPIADLAYNCFLWHCHEPGWGTLDGIDLSISGIPSEADYVQAYCERTGRSAIMEWDFYLAFAIFRLAAITQGVYRRSQLGNVSSDRLIENGTRQLAEQALHMLGRSA